MMILVIEGRWWCSKILWDSSSAYRNAAVSLGVLIESCMCLLSPHPFAPRGVRLLGLYQGFRNHDHHPPSSPCSQTFAAFRENQNPFGWLFKQRAGMKQKKTTDLMWSRSTTAAAITMWRNDSPRPCTESKRNNSGEIPTSLREEQKTLAVASPPWDSEDGGGGGRRSIWNFPRWGFAADLCISSGLQIAHTLHGSVESIQGAIKESAITVHHMSRDLFNIRAEAERDLQHGEGIPSSQIACCKSGTTQDRATYMGSLYAICRNWNSSRQIRVHGCKVWGFLGVWCCSWRSTWVHYSSSTSSSSSFLLRQHDDGRRRVS